MRVAHPTNDLPAPSYGPPGGSGDYALMRQYDGVAWREHDANYQPSGPIHLRPAGNGARTPLERFQQLYSPHGITLCGKPIGPTWVSRSRGLFFKRNKLKPRDGELCTECLSMSGGRGPIAKAR